MQEVPADVAKSDHGITTRHNLMPNGEFRFRLIKADGTAYVRTEAGGKGAWQKSHFHNNVRETYIVQKGWIALASKIDQRRRIDVYRTGELFTTQPGVIHNVYMPAGAVIHTVKHGDSKTEDRITDDHTIAFDAATEPITDEKELLSLDERGIDGQQAKLLEQTYNAVYRHYDDLIWRLPVFTSGLFSATMLGLNASTQETITKYSTIQGQEFSIAFVSLMFFVMLLSSYNLFRFRVHQRRARIGARRTTPIWKSASTLFSLLVSVETFALLGFALVFAGMPLAITIGVCSALAFSWTALLEILLRRSRI